METLSSRVGHRQRLSPPLRRLNGTTVPVEMGTAPSDGGKARTWAWWACSATSARSASSKASSGAPTLPAAPGTLAAGLAHEISEPARVPCAPSPASSRGKFEDPRFRETFMRVVPHELERINGIVEQLLSSRPGPAGSDRPPPRSRCSSTACWSCAPTSVDTSRSWWRGSTRDVPPVARGSGPALRGVRQPREQCAGGDGARADGSTVRTGWHRGAEAEAGGGGRRRVRVEIEDSGSGISPRRPTKCSIRSSPPRRRGTGLGPRAGRTRSSRTHGGSIGFRSAPGWGPTFAVVLPPGRGAAVRRA